MLGIYKKNITEGALATLEPMENFKDKRIAIVLPLLISPVEDLLMLVSGFSVSGESVEMVPLGLLGSELHKIVAEVSLDNQVGLDDIFYATGAFHGTKVELWIDGPIDQDRFSRPFNYRVQDIGEWLYLNSLCKMDLLSMAYCGRMLLTIWNHKLTVPSSPIFPMAAILGGLPVCHKGHYCG